MSDELENRYIHYLNQTAFPALKFPVSDAIWQAHRKRADPKGSPFTEVTNKAHSINLTEALAHFDSLLDVFNNDNETRYEAMFNALEAITLGTWRGEPTHDAVSAFATALYDPKNEVNIARDEVAANSIALEVMKAALKAKDHFMKHSTPPRNSRGMH